MFLPSHARLAAGTPGFEETCRSPAVRRPTGGDLAPRAAPRIPSPSDLILSASSFDHELHQLIYVVIFSFPAKHKTSGYNNIMYPFKMIHLFLNQKGHFGFQDHGQDCWYKNIKVESFD